MKKIILHIDVDSFFVSAEIANKPHLKDKDVVISTNRTSGISLSVSYSLKKRGVIVPEKIENIKKISSELYLFEPKYKLYYDISKKIFDLLKKYTNEIEIYSIDEWFLDVTKFITKYDSIRTLAEMVKKDIFKSLNIPVSIGVSYNIFLAKMANYLAKPFGIFLIKNIEDVKKYVWPLKIEQYFGIGKRKINALHKNNIWTIRDIATTNKNDINLYSIFKNTLGVIVENANGIGDDKINDKNELSKTISKSKTFEEGATNDEKKIINNIYKSSLELASIMITRKDFAEILILKIYSTKGVINSKHKHNYFQSFNSIFNCSKNLFFNEWDEEFVYKIEIKLTNINDENILNKQLNIFSTETAVSVEKEIINNINNTLQKKELVILSENKPKRVSKQLKTHLE